MFFYQISTLTTGKDTFTGGALDDMFTAENAGVGGQTHTLTAGDILDGGAGNDTLLLDNQGNVNAGLQTVKNIENLKVYQSGTGANDWSGDVSAFAGLQNVEVTTIGTVKLTAGDSVTNVALNGALDGVELTGNGIANVSAHNMAPGANQVLTVNNTTADHTLNVALDKVGKVKADGTADKTLNIVDANAATIALTSNGTNAANIGDGSTANTVLKTVNIAGKGDLVLDLNAAQNTAVTTINGEKAEGDLKLGDLAAATATITTGAGDDEFTTGAIAGKATINTGAGDDTVVLTGSTLEKDSVINLGAGDDSLTMTFADLTKNLKIDGDENTADGIDKLIFSDAATFTKDQYALFDKTDGIVKGFELIGVKGNFVLDADATKLGVTEFSASETGHLVLTNMLADSTVTFSKGAMTAASSLTLTKNGTLDLVLENVGDTAFVSTTTNKIDTDKANVINVSSDHVADATNASSANANVLFLDAQDRATVNLTGSQELHYINNANVIQEINAGTFTGKLMVTGNAAADTITAGTNGSTIIGLAGADTLIGGSGADSFVYGAKAGIVTAANADTIQGFNASVDKIKFDVKGDLLAGATGAAASTLTGDGAILLGVTFSATIADNKMAAMKGVISDTTTSVADINAVFTALGTALDNSAGHEFAVSAAGGVVARVVEFTQGKAAGTYLVINDGTAAFQVANDVVIHLTGLEGIITADSFAFA